MKILLIAPQNRRRTKLTRWLHRHDAIIVGMGVFRGIHILEEIARTSPHLVVFANDQVDSDTEAVLTFVSEKFRSVNLIRLPMMPGDREVPVVWTDFLLKTLKAPLPAYLPIPYAAESRLVFHDPAFDNFSWADKLTRGSLPIDHQIAKLFLLLDGGLRNHQLAQSYLALVEASMPGLDAELSYRWAHGSYKCLSWARDMVAKFASVLSHYVPGVEAENLPPPCPIHKSVDYVHYYQSNEGHYSLSVLSQLSINRAISELLIASSQWIFTGQGGVNLAAEQAQLFGLAKFMHQIAKAHVAVMDRWLKPDQVRAGEELSREAHRQEGIVRDFWDWGTDFEDRKTLAGLLDAYHQQTWRPNFNFPPFPSYSEFIDKYSSGRTE